MPRLVAFPDLPPRPEVACISRLSERAASQLDAILALVPADAGVVPLAALPQSERWRRLRARLRPGAGAVQSAPLANARDTRAVLGLLPPRASTFEMLTLAGRLLKEISGEAERIALFVPSPAKAGGQDPLGALLSAALAHAFELPSFRGSGDTSGSGASASPEARRPLRRIEVVDGDRIDMSYIDAASRGNDLVRFLTALPSNVLDVRGYRRFIERYAREHGLGLTWLGEPALERLGANAFLAVSRGNAERTAGIAHLTYRPARRDREPRRTAARSRGGRRTPALRAGESPEVALIGKGILFDTGGTNLKPHRSMLDMHTDMSGSAVALATLGGLARLNAPVSADAWLAISENRLGPRSYVPQEVVRAANGVTIQVIHTDAEGRMVLADTLALAARARPALMIDFATLTGTCIQALTERMSGIVTNAPHLTPTLLEAGSASGERMWSFPFDPDYDSDLESKLADVLQCSVDGKGDHILAARFLSRFVPQAIPWVHVDLSSAVRPGGLAHVPTDVTGFGVRYALELLLRTGVLDELAAPR